MDISVVGRLFWCSIQSKANWLRSVFEVAMLNADVPAEVSPALSKRSDFIRALRSMEEGRLVRLVKEDKEEVVFQATEEFLDGYGGLSYRKEALVTLDKITGNIESTNDDFTMAILERVGTEGDIYRGDDLRRLIVRLLSKNAQSLKPRSGVWFVPETKSAWIKIIKNFL
ncbi:MAG: hypothetical protein KDH96_07670, partial [Candidatus Riesia sp.]|nr:hypothetical protein [Candidatus Riesia sp.]